MKILVQFYHEEIWPVITKSRVHPFARRWLAGLIALAAIGLAGCKPSGAGTNSYETTVLARGDLVQHVTASGTLSAVVSVDVGSQVSGKISALYVDFNSPVKKGQLVAEIDPTVYEAAQQQAEGQLASAKAEATLKRQNLERKKVLVPLKAASQLDLDQATAELAQAEAAVVIQEAALESAKANLGYCKITAPVDGVVISRKVDLGQTVNAAMNTPVLFTVAQDITKMNISAAVSEADIGQVRVGQTVDFTVDAFPDEVFHGKVTQVENPEQKLFPGMTADVSILVSERKDVLKIPNTALRYSPPDGVVYDGVPPKKLDRSQRLVYSTSADGAKLKPVIIKTGITDGSDTEVTEGLKAGESVVTSTLAATTKGGFGSPPPQAPQ